MTDRNRPERNNHSTFTDSFTESQVEADGLRRLLDLSGMSIARCSADGAILYSTPAFATLFSSTPSELLTRPIRELLDSSMESETGKRMDTSSLGMRTPVAVRISNREVGGALSLDGGPLFRLEMKKVLLADTTTEIHVSLEHVGTTEALVGSGYKAINSTPGEAQLSPSRPLMGRYVEDATLWELEQSSLFRAQISNPGAWIIDIPTNTVVWSESTFLTLGIPLPAEGKPHFMGFEQWVHPDDLHRVTQELYEPLMMPMQFAIDTRAISGDGSTRYIQAIGETYKTDQGLATPDRSFGVFLDTTDQVLAARTLGMAMRIDDIFAAYPEAFSEALPQIVEALCDAGGFSYTAYHQKNGNGDSQVAAFSGTNRFMATEEMKRVQEVLETGIASRLTDSANPRNTVLAVFLPVQAKGKCRGVLAVWSDEPGQFSPIVTQYLDNLAINIGRLCERFDALAKTNPTMRTLATMFGAAIESHTPFDAGRHPRVAALSVAIAEQLEVAPADVYGFEIAASIYDMGMLWISDRITMAHPVSLTPEDKMGIRRHTTIGESIASSFEWPWPIADVMGQHHEHWDGTGYPRGAKGEEISLAARVVAVAAAYENLMRHRPYEAVLSANDALGAIVVRAGTHFDPTVVEALENVVGGGFTFAGDPMPSAGDKEADLPMTQIENR